MSVLSKEEFVKVINKLQECIDFENKIADAFYSFDCQAPEFPLPYDVIVDTLNTMFDLNSNTSWGSDIDYFCIELDFGRKYEPECITYADGTEIDMSTPEKLYDYLLETYVYGEEE